MYVLAFCIRRLLLTGGFLLIVIYSLWAQPSASFDYSSNGQGSSCAPVTINFQNTSTNGATSFLWSINNTTFSNEEDPLRTFTIAGTYEICLEVSNSAAQTDNTCQTITIFESPTISLDVNPASGCVPHETELTVNSTVNIDSIEWDLGNGVIVRESIAGLSSSINHNYTTPGIYTITITVYDMNGCETTYVESNAVSVGNIPNPSFTGTPRSGCNLPTTVNFTNPFSASDYSFEWDFGDGNSSTEATPSHVYQSFGQFEVALTVTNLNTLCSNTISIPNYISIGDIVDFDYAITNTGDCSTTTVNFTNTSSGEVASLNWDFGDGNSSTDAAPTHTYTTVGCYTPSLSITTTDGCSSTMTATDCIEVINNTSVDYTTQGALSTCDLGTGLTVGFNGVSNQAVSWNWDFGGQGTSDEQNPTFTFTQYGTFPVTLTVTFANGCEESITKETISIAALNPSISSDETEGCSDLTINFTGMANAADPIASYNWDFEIATSTEQNPTVVYTDTGSFDVLLVVESLSGCIDSIRLVDYIHVGMQPIVEFSADPLQTCIEDFVSFTDESSDFVDEWFWDFGDGATSNEQSPIHEYNDTGRLDVMLITWFNGCSDTLIKEAYIDIEPPKANFYFLQDCDNATEIIFRDSSLGADRWLWDFGDGTTSDVQHPIHSYTSPGTYTVTLTVYNDISDCQDDHMMAVIVDSVLPSFTLSDTNICLWDTIQVINNSTNLSSFSWEFPSQVGMLITSISDPEPQFYFPSPGDYTGFILTVTAANGCISSYEFPDTVHVSGIFGELSADIQSGCPPMEVQFHEQAYAYSGEIVSYEWDFGDGNTSTDENPTHEYTTEGAFTVTLVTTNSEGCVETTVRNAFINVEEPIANFQATITDCGSKEYLFNNTSNGINLNYEWDFGDGNTSTDFSPNHSYQDTGYYEVCLIVTGDTNCKDSYCDSILVTAIEADFEGDNLYKSCPNPPLVTNFTDLSNDAISWSWDFGDNTGISTLQNPSHSYSQPGSYTVCLTVMNAAACEDTKCINNYIQVDGPSGNFSFDPNTGCGPLEVTFIANGTNALSYQWDFGDGTGVNNTTGATADTVSHIYNFGGSYTPVLIIEDNNGCRVPLVGDEIVLESLGVDFTVADSTFCENDNISIDFTALIPDPSIITSIDWHFPGATTTNSTEENPSGISYNQPGYYSVSLSVSSLLCDFTIEKDSFIVVHPNPVAEFLMTPNDGCVPVEVAFNDESTISSGQISSRTWDLGNGLSSNAEDLTFNYLNSGVYNINLTVISDQACTDMTEKLLTIYDEISVDAGENQNICIGETVPLQAISSTENLNYSWTPATGLDCTNCPNPMASPILPTMYMVSITSENGCVATDSVMINAGPYSIPNISLTEDEMICEGDSFDLLVSVADVDQHQFQWDENQLGLSCYDCPNPTATPLENTVYYLTVTNAGGCESVDSVALTIHLPDMEILSSDRTICEGETLQLEVLDGTNPIWNISSSLSCLSCPNPIASPEITSTYMVSVTTDFGCLVTEEITVHVLTPDDIDAGEDLEICEGENTTLYTNTEIASSSWLTNGILIGTNVDSIVVNPDSSTNYVLSIIEDECMLYDTVAVSIIYKPQLTGNDYELCRGEHIEITVDGDADEYEWFPSDDLSSTTTPITYANPTSSTTYQVVGYEDGCVSDTALVNLNVNLPPEVTINAQVYFREGEDIPLSVDVDGVGGYSYEWIPSEYLSCTDCPDPIVNSDSSSIFTVVVTDANSCIDSASISLNLLKICDEQGIIVPNAFTPNEDGENDIFYVRGSTEISSFRIFNRWGELVFETDSKNDGWDGSYKGQKLNKDVYIYYIEGICKYDGSPIIKTGDITLLR